MKRIISIILLSFSLILAGGGTGYAYTPGQEFPAKGIICDGEKAVALFVKAAKGSVNAMNNVILQNICLRVSVPGMMITLKSHYKSFYDFENDLVEVWEIKSTAKVKSFSFFIGESMEKISA